jgi:hypothetical protein
MLAGCTEGTVKWDYPNENVVIAVKSESGRNLLDPGYSGNILEGITVTYNGEEYPWKIEPKTRAEPDLPEMTGLRLSTSWDITTSYVLLFGEFSIDTKNDRGETFTINWGDGTTSEVGFDLYATPNGKNEQPTIHKATRLDGEPHANLLVINIVRE